MRTRAVWMLAVILGVWLAGCGGPEVRRYEVRGEVMAIDAARNEITLKHEPLPGYMPGMTMPFSVRDGGALAGLARGDLVVATLVVSGNEAYLEGLTRTGTAEPEPAALAPPASSGFELLKVGDAVPDARFVDEQGRPRTLAESRGRVVALTFIYTRCPLPTFCPQMDRHFAAIQRRVRASPALRDRVQLFSISFDPAYDTPAVLEAHARSLEADPATWSFLTGDRDEIDRFASRFGVTITRAEDPADIAHNLRTVVIDPGGRIARIYTGFEWKPEQVLSDLASVARGD